MARCGSSELTSTRTTSARCDCICRTIGSVALRGKPILLKTIRPTCVLSKRFWSTASCSRSSVRTATAMPCMAWLSLKSFCICMILGNGPLSKVTFVTCGNQSTAILLNQMQGPKRIDYGGQSRHYRFLLGTFYANRQWLKRAGKPGNRRSARDSSSQIGKNICGKLRRYAARLRSNLHLLLFCPPVQGRDSAERVRNFACRLRQILITRKVNCDSELCAHRRLRYSEHGSLASDAHAFAQRDFGRHQQGHLNHFSNREREIGKEECSLCAEILRKSAGFVLCPGQFY